MRKKDFTELPELQDVVKKVEKDLSGNGRVLLRYSGTENLARVMVEGKDGKLVKTSCETIASTLKKLIGEA